MWAGALGWHAKRLYLQPEAERLASAARTLPPGVAYYALFRGGRQIGWARSEIDTLPDGGGFLTRDLLELELDGFGLGSAGGATIRSRAELGPSLSLRSFSLEAEGLLGGLGAQGAVEGDSALVVALRRGSEISVRRLTLEGPVVPATALPLRLAVERESRPGDRFTVRTFDPTGLRPTTRTVEVEERAMMTYPDSAVRDSAGAPWSPARRDTVLAWRLGRELAGRRLDAWVDGDGRLLEVRAGGDLRMTRTAFEIAYFGFRGEPVRHGTIRPLEGERGRGRR